MVEVVLEIIEFGKMYIVPIGTIAGALVSIFGLYYLLKSKWWTAWKNRRQQKRIVAAREANEKEKAERRKRMGLTKKWDPAATFKKMDDMVDDYIDGYS